MSKYIIQRKYMTKSAEFIIDVIKAKLKEDGVFVGIGRSKEYLVNRISRDAIHYTPKSKNQGDSEDINIEDLSVSIEVMKRLDNFNTNTILLKERIPNSIFRKRTPLFGMLSYAEVIVEVTE